MVRKFERWVWIGGGLLALNGGKINGVGLSGVAKQPVSHVTGTTTFLALAIGNGNLRAVSRAGAFLGTFAAGAALADFIVTSKNLKREGRYAT
ncbi:MAG TPA: DUF1275 family protein [Opitutaceae bacterium]|jgi:uncharacterized membrane protein YoaK (UPF0700 family)